ncbi:MAG TPA: aldehyde dehydrogenase family protein, partial [Cytophagales bacterium]|nr:aldehyde dehydrogenase family protein [Cytophagales bacterium]
KVGSPWELDTQIGPLAVPLNHKLQKVLEREKARWLIKPKVQGQLMSPGVLWGVTPNDMEYQRELFGPILCVMKADDLKEAIALSNGVDFGLTSGLESLDEDEINTWKSLTHVGNLYINRSTTGAIVQRQPFGGLKSSCFGFGMKAGGMHYIKQFLKPDLSSFTYTESLPEKFKQWQAHLSEMEAQELGHAEKNYSESYFSHFSKEIDYAHIRGQYNLNRYLKPEKIVLCIDAQVGARDITMVLGAADVMGLRVEVLATEDTNYDDVFTKSGIHIHRLASWDDVETYLHHHIAIRALNKNRLPLSLLKKAHDKAIHIYGDAPVALGSFELLNYLTEQSISYSYHRYGNLMGKSES